MYLWYGISAGTRQAYGAAVSSFASFCRGRGWGAPYAPASADRVEAWVAEETRKTGVRGLGGKALRRKVAALVTCIPTSGCRLTASGQPNWKEGLLAPTDTMGLCQTTTLADHDAYLTRHHCHHQEEPQRIRWSGKLPRGGRLLHLVLHLLYENENGREITYNKYEGGFDLSRSSVATDGEMRLTIPASKTDPFRKEVMVVIPKRRGWDSPRSCHEGVV